MRPVGPIEQPASWADYLALSTQIHADLKHQVNVLRPDEERARHPEIPTDGTPFTLVFTSDPFRPWPEMQQVLVEAGRRFADTIRRRLDDCETSVFEVMAIIDLAEHSRDTGIVDRCALRTMSHPHRVVRTRTMYLGDKSLPTDLRVLGCGLRDRDADVRHAAIHRLGILVARPSQEATRRLRLVAVDPDATAEERDLALHGLRRSRNSP